MKPSARALGPGLDGGAGASAADGTEPPSGTAPESGTEPEPGTEPASGGKRRPGLRRWRGAIAGLLALAIVGAAAWVVFGSSLLAVRQVRVAGNRLVPTAEVVAAARIRLGTPLAMVNTGAVARRVERIAPVLRARVTRSWPETIVIRVTERSPALAVASTSGYRLIDGAGVTVRTAVRKPPGMPLLTSPPAVLRGSPAVRAAATVVTGLPRQLRTRVVSVSAARSGPAAGTVTLRLSRGVTVVWGGTSGARRKAAELIVLLRTHARYIDVSDPNTAVTK